MPALKAKVVLAAIRGEKTLTELRSGIDGSTKYQVVEISGCIRVAGRRHLPATRSRPRSAPERNAAAADGTASHSGSPRHCSYRAAVRACFTRSERRRSAR